MGEKNWRRRRKNIEEIYCGIFLFLMGKRAGLGGEGEEHEAGQKKKTANGVPLPPSLPPSLSPFSGTMMIRMRIPGKEGDEEPKGRKEETQAEKG